ncbi:hypothetical protein ACCO45_003377 [Purpureocillium lilacinum]|uniref:Uncharacterized protein n=1 Tax=Purpureocillium lilacinum TaxID=33203 RepID=A0ACC4E144_PURLI
MSRDTTLSGSTLFSLGDPSSLECASPPSRPRASKSLFYQFTLVVSARFEYSGALLASPAPLVSASVLGHHRTFDSLRQHSICTTV